MKHEFRYFLVLSSLAVALTLAATWLSAAASTVPGSSGNAGEDWSDPGSAATPFIPSRLNPAAPSGRANHSLTQVGSSLYLFGGGSITSTGGTMNDLWRFDAASNAWVRVEPGAGPSARKGHAAANLGGQLYILGGEDNSGGKLDDVWRYDPASGKWYEVAQDTRPPARSIPPPPSTTNCTSTAAR